jgi:preprotein translocase subunit SecD
VQRSYVARLPICVAVLWWAMPVLAQPLGLEIASASAAFDQRTSQPLVVFTMTEASRRLFADFTLKNVGRKMDLRVDGRTVMSPVIREPIVGGTGQIIGGLTADGARELAERLSSGAAKLEVEAAAN